MTPTEFYRRLSPIFGLSGRRKREAAGRRRFGDRAQAGLSFLVKFALFAVMAFTAWHWSAAVLTLMDGPKRILLEEVTVKLTSKSDAVQPVRKVLGQPPTPPSVDGKAPIVVQLARKDLGQPPGPTSADEKPHIEFSREGSIIYIRNLSYERRLDLTFGEERFETSTDRLPIPTGQISRLIVNGGRLTFSNVGARSFDLENDSGAVGRFHYQGVGLSPRLERVDGGAWNEDCHVRAGWSVAARDLTLRLRGVLNVLHLWRPRDFDVATLGGRFDCEDEGRRQIGGVGDLPWRALRIVRREDEFFLVPYDIAARGSARFGFGSAASADDLSRAPRVDFANQALPVNDDKAPHGKLVELTAGRTTYKVAFDVNNGVAIHLTPIRKIPLIDPAVCGAGVAADVRDKAGCPEGSATTGRGADSGAMLWRWSQPRNPLADLDGAAALRELKSHERVLRYAFVGVAVLLSAWLTGALGFLTRFATRRESAAAAPIAAAAFAATCVSALLALAPEALLFLSDLLHLPWLSVSARVALQITLFNWLLAGAALLSQRGALALGLMWIAAITLAAVGSTSLAAMAADGDNTSWALYFVRQKYMFLDLLPPFVVALATCPLRALNPALRELVWSTDRRYGVVRYLPAIGLGLAFVGWALFGTQTGFGGGFQPAEPGKFASILIAATLLLRFDPNAGPARGAGRRLLSALGPAILLASFVFLLVAVPVFRSDWGPAVIMGLLLGGLVLFFILPLAWRAIEVAWRRQLQRDAAPLPFRPRLPASRRTPALFGAGILLATFLVALMLPWLAPLGAKWALGLSSWPTNAAAMLSKLESEGLNGGRRVVAERLIAWTDLDYAKPAWPDCGEPDNYAPTSSTPSPARTENPTAALKPRACYRDLEWQVVRARKAVAEAPCGLAGPLGGLSAEGAITSLVGFAADWMAAPCGAPADAAPARPSLQLAGPIAIPVVESDFATAYLFGRLGTGAAALFYLAQAMLTAVGLWAYLRIASMRAGGRVETGVRRFLSVVVAGSTLLLVLQWTLSWSNVLGLLPVIGQPMTMLSYAVSHHLFAALPCLLAIVVGLRFAAAGDRVTFAPRGAPRTRRSRF